MKKPTSKFRTAPTLRTILGITLYGLSAIAILITIILQFYSSTRTQQAALAAQQQLIAQETSKTVNNFIQEKFTGLETAEQTMRTAARSGRAGANNTSAPAFS